MVTCVLSPSLLELTVEGPPPCKPPILTALITFPPSQIPTPAACGNTTNVCLGTKIPFEQALTATFLEGLVFLLICVTGERNEGNGQGLESGNGEGLESHIGTSWLAQHACGAMTHLHITNLNHRTYSMPINQYIVALELCC
jgi:hypothetical protein